VARKYRKRRRAALEEETRRRITEALVALHGTIGPARTTVQAVAEEAGVQRATVYRHFPDEASMYAACSAHWAQENPPPDPAAWADVDDPARRLRTALAEMYAYYARNEAMLANVIRDETLVPAVGPALQAFRDYLAAARDVLARGYGRGARKVRRAALVHALAFATWRSLVRDNALTRVQAVDLMAGMVERAAARR
jgi:AcrR family transcriptional regulator